MENIQKKYRYADIPFPQRSDYIIIYSKYDSGDNL